MGYDGESVIWAALMTTGVVFALTVYACFTDRDFTKCGALLFIFLISLILFSLFAYISQVPWARKFALWAGVILFSFYLVYDTQLVVGGEGRSFQLTTDDYIIGALIIYTDIILLFIKILQATGNRN